MLPAKNPLASIDEVRETDEDCIYSSEYKSSQNTGRNSNGNATPSVNQHSLNASQKKSNNPDSTESLSPPTKGIVPSLNFEDTKQDSVREITDIQIFDRPKADIERVEKQASPNQPLNQSLSTRTLSPGILNDGQARPFKKLALCNKENLTAKKESSSREFADRRVRNARSNHQKQSPFIKNTRWYKSEIAHNYPPSIELINRPSNILKEKSPNNPQLFKFTDQSAEVLKHSESSQLQIAEEMSAVNPFKKSMKKYISSKDINMNVLNDFLDKNTKTLLPMNRGNLGFKLNSMRSKQKSQGNFETNARDISLPSKEQKLVKPLIEDQSNDQNQKWLSPNAHQHSESKASRLRQEELSKPHFASSSSYFNQVIQNLRQVPSLISRSDSVKPKPYL